MKIIIVLNKGMVESVYSEMESLEVYINDRDCMEEDDMYPVDPDMNCLYEA